MYLSFNRNPTRCAVGTEDVVFLAFLSSPLVAILITRVASSGKVVIRLRHIKVTILSTNTLHDILLAPACLPAVGPCEAYFAFEEQKKDKGVQV